MEPKFWIEIIAALTIPLCLIVIAWNRVKTEKGLGMSALRFLVVGSVLPVLTILGLERVLEAGTIGSILGAIVGYLFSESARQPKSE